MLVFLYTRMYPSTPYRTGHVAGKCSHLQLVKPALFELTFTVTKNGPERP